MDQEHTFLGSGRSGIWAIARSCTDTLLPTIQMQLWLDRLSVLTMRNNDFEPSMIFSLDHNVWMHQHEMRADQWMLFENTSTVAGRGRAFTTGKLWSEDGTLILSCTQEIVLRSRGTVSRI
ncbi:hypothetical protein OESDEN_10412 [Oesophagostomum dentatum]|uniref:Acyl-CoA thioesterase-like C-terminal domain-containing protein n=1 Tax=Oesophagostomum dentatum TaxID=61180 RepID=A0A0B1SXR0_OESDE|nr:hypothetical protein OESDEN_10412 [Oesophagostomum dentatum]